MGEPQGLRPRPGAASFRARWTGGRGLQAGVYPSALCSLRTAQAPAQRDQGGAAWWEPCSNHPLPPPLPSCPQGGAWPKLPHPGAACTGGFAGETPAMGRGAASPLTSSPGLSGITSPALGQERAPCHPTWPCQGHAAGPPAQKSEMGVTAAAGETAAATEQPRVWPGPWLVT